MELYRVWKGLKLNWQKRVWPKPTVSAAVPCIIHAEILTANFRLLLLSGHETFLENCRPMDHIIAGRNYVWLIGSWNVHYRWKFTSEPGDNQAKVPHAIKILLRAIKSWKFRQPRNNSSQYPGEDFFSFKNFFLSGTAFHPSSASAICARPCVLCGILTITVLIITAT